METGSKTRGGRIAALRKARGWTQPHLAGELGVTKATVSKWEAAASPDISLETFFRLAEVLEVDAQELATGHASKAAKTDDIPQRRLDLIRTYGRLPDEVRMSVRSLIETLSLTFSERYAKWSAAEGARARERDKKRGEPA